MSHEPSILETTLDDLIATHRLTELYRDRLANDPLTGRVVRRSQWLVQLEKLDEQHQHDGVSVVRPGDITRLRTGGRDMEQLTVVASPPRDELALPPEGLLEFSAAATLLTQR